MTPSTQIPESIRQHIKQLERVRQDFVANVSHELRTPLTVMHGYLSAIVDMPDVSLTEHPDIFKKMLKQCVRMENIINDLLFLSDLENSHVQAQAHHPIDVPSLLINVIEEARQVSNGQHELTIDCQQTLHIMGEAFELKSLFSNLIINAVKYTPPGGRIDVVWQRGQDLHPTLTVSDTGIGIEAVHIPRITERFYRVNKDRSRQSGGTGLGLAIVKHILMNYEAELIIESVPSAGSSFTCLFPTDRSTT